MKPTKNLAQFDLETVTHWICGNGRTNLWTKSSLTRLPCVDATNCCEDIQTNVLTNVRSAFVRCSFGMCVRALKEMVKCAPKTVFLSFLGKHCFFRKKLLNKKNIQHLISDTKVIPNKKRLYLFIFGVRWPLTGRTGTFTSGNITLSDTLPTPEIFLFGGCRKDE